MSKRLFGEVTVEVGKAYIDAMGRLIEITGKTGEGNSVVFTDAHGRGYRVDGRSKTGKPLKRLVDRALAVKVGETYDYHWPDKQSVGRYTVTGLTDRGYGIVWSNNATNFIQYGCPLNYDSVLVES